MTTGYTDDGQRQVTVACTDTVIQHDPCTVETQIEISVQNLPLTAYLSNTGPVDQGVAATVSFSNQANQSDASRIDSQAGFHYAYACDGGSLDSCYIRQQHRL